ncbi:MAG: DUF4290 domain-containing protein [Muribaculaceae bacterium]|nr:DUF4290 domain-containing protein [Muribaculaceae bacterium]
MLTYNTNQKTLRMPEYGRNIQSMLDYCLALPDRSERNAAAAAIVKTMGILFPQLRETPGDNSKFWDHLAIMSGFSADIDWPEGTVNAEELSSKPDKVEITQGNVKYRCYGRMVERMMNYAASLPAGDEKDQLIFMIADQMKKSLLAITPDGVDDSRIFADIAEMTHGEIRLDPKLHRLHTFRIVPPTTKKRHRK